MKSSKRSIFAAFAAAFLFFYVIGLEAQAEEKETIILYTNDVHCGIDNYAKIAAYAAQLEEAGREVLIVDLGDAIQGEVIGTQSEGEDIITLMNEVGYDIAVPGNHEYDYGMERFLELATKEENTFDYISCNFVDLRTGDTVFDAYDIREVNGEKLAFIGVTTPESYTKSLLSYFQDENENLIYGFSQENLYEAVQDTVDEVTALGADRVIMLSHMGIQGITDGWKSTDVIANTTGIDVVLDGHSHEVIPGDRYQNEIGEDVLLSSTGFKLQYFGALTLAADGETMTELIQADDIDVESSAGVKTVYEKVQAKINEMNGEIAYLYDVIGTSDVQLVATQPDTGEWLVRNQETNLGDFVADAYRILSGADIGLVNGGGIRKTVESGDINRKMLMNVNPWNNEMCVVSATGQQIMDALEHGARLYPEFCGSFLQVSGLTYEIHGYVESAVMLNEVGGFLSIDENAERRVKNVKVNGIPIDPEKEYSVIGNYYTLKQGGDGFNMFLDSEILKYKELPVDSELLIQYFMETLNGNISEEQYGNVNGEGRIVIYETEADVPAEEQIEEQEEEITSPQTGMNQELLILAMSLVVIGCMFVPQKQKG